MYRCKLPEIPVPIYRLAPRGSLWEDALCTEVTRWPIQGKHVVSELLDVGGWKDVAEDVVRDLIPDWVPIIG